MKRFSLFSILSLLLPLTIAFGQEKTPVNLTVNPKVSVPGASVILKGSSGIDIEGATTMKITITTPVANRSVTLTPVISKDGDFQAVFTDTKEIGKYTVKAISPGGSGQASDTFQILGPAPAMEEYDKEVKELIPVAEKGIERVLGIINDLPDSKDKEEVKKKSESLKQKIAEIKEQANLSEATQPLMDQIKKAPEEAPLAAPVFDMLSQWNTQSEEDRVRINEELIKSSEEGEDCERIDQAIEALNLTSFLVNLIAIPFSGVSSFATDFLASKVSDWGAGDAGGIGFKNALNLTLSRCQKVETLTGQAFVQWGWRKGPMGKEYHAPELDIQQPSEWTEHERGIKSELPGTVLGLAIDLVNLCAKGYFGSRCERLEGPLQGEMDGQIAKNGTIYWKFKIGLRGKLVLRHAKEEPGKAIRVRGQLMGFGTSFSVEEDMVRVLFPDVLKKTRAITFHKVSTPVVNVALDALNDILSSQGAAAQSLFSPTSFYIPVEGDMVNDKLTLRLKPARFDFNEHKAAAHAVYVLLSPIAIAPYVINQELPYKNADFIITHAMKAEDTRQTELKVTVDSAKKMTIVSADFNRDFENKETEAEAKYTLTLKACNPSCQ